ncbi:MAG: outer membrane protein assembly factor BamD [Pedosphaera sp.]|nr:outer membrane protein assembly factor BamD [Pedosphaera sp.]
MKVFRVIGVMVRQFRSVGRFADKLTEILRKANGEFPGRQGAIQSARYPPLKIYAGAFLTDIFRSTTVQAMKRWFIQVVLTLIFLAALPSRCPAPLTYRAGEGWSYEPEGGAKWTRTRAKDQLEVAQEAFDKKNYSLSLKAARRTVRVWPLSDYAAGAQYLLARSYAARGKDEKAFKEYQKLIEKYPKVENYEEVVQQQFIIANRYLGGQWFKLWNYIPFFPSMEKTTVMYEKIIRNGLYSEVAPQAQMNIGAAREKQSDYPLAVKAYEKAADTYHDQPKVAAEAIYKSGLAYTRQAKKAEYDQNSSTKAIETFGSFSTLYPEDKRVSEAEKLVSDLKTEQAKGAFKIAQFYEKKKKWDGALVYYNEAYLKDPQSSYGKEAKQRIDELRKRTAEQPAAK